MIFLATDRVHTMQTVQKASVLPYFTEHNRHQSIMAVDKDTYLMLPIHTAVPLHSIRTLISNVRSMLSSAENPRKIMEKQRPAITNNAIHAQYKMEPNFRVFNKTFHVHCSFITSNCKYFYTYLAMYV